MAEHTSFGINIQAQKSYFFFEKNLVIHFSSTPLPKGQF